MRSSNHKKALIIGVFFALAALLVPGLTRICQAAIHQTEASRPCCQGKTKCAAHVKSECCCQSSTPTSRNSVPVPQVNPETAKIFPLISALVPTIQIWGASLNHREMTLAFHAPPPFLAHHAFLC